MIWPFVIFRFRNQFMAFCTLQQQQQQQQLHNPLYVVSHSQIVYRLQCTGTRYDTRFYRATANSILFHRSVIKRLQRQRARAEWVRVGIVWFDVNLFRYFAIDGPVDLLISIGVSAGDATQEHCLCCELRGPVAELSSRNSCIHLQFFWFLFYFCSKNVRMRSPANVTLPFIVLIFCVAKDV